jgi:hypothetical protein
VQLAIVANVLTSYHSMFPGIATILFSLNSAICPVASLINGQVRRRPLNGHGGNDARTDFEREDQVSIELVQITSKFGHVESLLPPTRPGRRLTPTQTQSTRRPGHH